MDRTQQQGQPFYSWIVPCAVVMIAVAAAFLVDRHVNGISYHPDRVSDAPTLLRHAVLSDGRRLELHDSDNGILEAGDSLRLVVGHRGYQGGDEIVVPGEAPQAAHLHVLDGDIAVVAIGDVSGRWRVHVFSPASDSSISATEGPLFELEIDAQPTAFAVLPGANGDAGNLLVGDVSGRILWKRQGGPEETRQVYRHETWIRFLRLHENDGATRLTSISADGVVVTHEVDPENASLTTLSTETNPDYWLHNAPGREVAVLPEPGTELTVPDCPACPKVVVIREGTFSMGSPPDEPERFDTEGPQREVTIPRFAMGITEVTFAAWDACAADEYCQSNPNPSDEGWGRGDRPVINVSWEDITDERGFLDWMNSKIDGTSYRLPSESEWEFAARAGTTTPFWTGQTIDSDQANFDATVAYNGSAKGEYRRQTMPVRSFSANPNKLFDVHGNVWEWVQDCWHPSYDGAPTDQQAWMDEDNGDCSTAVLRGGSWGSGPWGLRSAHRVRNPRDIRVNVVGFRVARTLTP